MFLVECNTAIEIVSLVFGAILLVGCLIEGRTDSKAIWFKPIVVITYILNALDVFAIVLRGNKTADNLALIINTVLYVLGYIALVLFTNYQKKFIKETKFSRAFTQFVNISAIFMIAATVLNMFYGYFFTITDHFYTHARYFNLTQYYSIIVMIGNIIVTATHKGMTKSVRFSLFSYSFLPFVAIVAQLFLDIRLIYAVSMVSVYILYVNVYTMQSKELAKIEKELTETKINSLLLQINPHFIYNTLGSVASLCREDPETAEKVLYSFSHYLRDNFSEIARKSKISFTSEIEHLKTYIEIEKLRFPDIEVVLDVHSNNFEIPTLSIQPLVENAITHGIMGLESGGKITIYSYEDRYNYFISVKDNGIGFDTTAKKNDGRNHIGIENVRRRLKTLCEGELVINSTPGRGTEAKIIIPKNVDL